MSFRRSQFTGKYVANRKETGNKKSLLHFVWDFPPFTSSSGTPFWKTLPILQEKLNELSNQKERFAQNMFPDKNILLH